MRGRKTNMEDFDIKIEWVDPSMPEGKQSWDNGFRILARMIAEAYIKEQIEKRHLELANSGYVKDQPTTSTLAGGSSKIDRVSIASLKEDSRLARKSEQLPEDRLGFTVKDVAKFLGISHSSVYNAVKTGQIPSVKVGKRIVIPKDTLAQFLSSAR
mgnify:CR=1 FL=1